MARTELQELQQKIQETEQRLTQLQAGLEEVRTLSPGRRRRSGPAMGLRPNWRRCDMTWTGHGATWRTRFRRRPRGAAKRPSTWRREQARAELLAVQEQMRAETRALNEQKTRLATARATAAGLQAAAQTAEQARDTAKAQLAAPKLDADAVTRNLNESRAPSASPPKSASPMARPSSSSGPRARRGVRRHD